MVIEGTPCVSRTFDLGSHNAIEATIDVTTAGASFSLGVFLDEGNDGSNWTEHSSLVEPVGIGKTYARVAGLSSRYYRLRFVLDAGTSGTIIAIVNTSEI